MGEMSGKRKAKEKLQRPNPRAFPFNAYYRAKKKRPISTRTITSS